MEDRLKYTEEDRLISLFLHLGRGDSTSFHEGRTAFRLKIELQALGFEVTEDGAGAHYGSECGNLYGFLRGNTDQAPVLFSAHMDTVAPGHGKKPRAEGDRIVSDGTTVAGADDICGIVEILEGIRLAKMDPEGHGDIEVLFTIAEEVYGKGAEYFDLEKVRSKEAYVLDMSGRPGRAARKAPSIISFEALVTGKSAHAGFAPETGINALQAAAKAVARIPQGKISEQTTLNIGTMRAGTANNIVPEECRCTGEVRSFDHEDALRQALQAEEIFREEAGKAGAEAETCHTMHIMAYETPEEAEVCRCFQRACGKLGLPGDLVETHGGSDNNIFAQSGLSGIVLSCGMHRTHSTEESAVISEMAEGARLVAAIIKERKRGGRTL